MNGVDALSIFGGLGLFLYGMKVMSEGLQTVAGDRLRAILSRATSNRVTGVLTGLAVTAIIQSSSATTVMLVSFVNAGLLDLTQAAGIVLGANIGTTATGWLVSLLGFKVHIATFALPAVALGFFVRFLKRERLTFWGEVLIGFGLLFLGLEVLKDGLPNVQESPELAAWLQRYHADSLGSTAAVILVGTVLTMLVQSSSAVMAITLAAAANGLIDFATAAALILGENIGTTITAWLAALGGTRTALRTAAIHSLFNLFGVLWVWLLFFPVIGLVDWLVPGDPALAADAPQHLAAFHSFFNLSNTLLVLPGLHLLVRLVARLVPDSGEPEPAHRLELIEPIFVALPSLGISEARRETERMLLTVVGMFDGAQVVARSPDASLASLIKEIEDHEHQVDRAEDQIAAFLVRVARHHLSEEQSAEVNQLMQMIGDIERMGDHAERIMQLASRLREKELGLTAHALQELDEIGTQVRQMLQLLLAGLARPQADLFEQALMMEERINALRDRMRKAHIKRLRKGDCEVRAGLLFLDMLTSFEKIGDHGFNVAEALTGRR